MAVPSLKLDLAPPSTLWRLNHALIGWAALTAGSLLLVGSLGITFRVYHLAAQAGRQEVATQIRTRGVENTQQKIMDELRSVDVTKELPRWRLAERIYTERSLPWSRLTAELERSLVLDVRLKSLQRTRGSDLKVQLKVKGEARTREAEANFVETLQKNPFFEQVILEREGERQGGGVDFEYTLTAQSTPPAYTPLPKYGPQPKPGQAPRLPVQDPRKAARPSVPLPSPLRTGPLGQSGSRPTAPMIPVQTPAAPQVSQRQAPPPFQPNLASPMNQGPNTPGFNRPPRARPRPTTQPGGEQ